MFAAEDPEVFASRVAEAFNIRKMTESLFRYNLYIDCMPMEGVGELDQASLKRMTEWAKGAPTLSKDKRYIIEQWLLVIVLYRIIFKYSFVYAHKVREAHGLL